MSLHRLYKSEILVPSSGLSRRHLPLRLPPDPATGLVPTLAWLRWESSEVQALFSVEGQHVGRGSSGAVVVRVEPEMHLELRASGPAGASLRLWLEHDAAGPPLVRVAVPGFEARALSNLVGLSLEADRPIRSVRLGGRDGFFGRAWGDRRFYGTLLQVPLEAEEGELEGLVVAEDGTQTELRVPYRLAEGLRPRALVLDPLPQRIGGRRGEILSFVGRNLDRTLISWPTERGPVRRSLREGEGGAWTARIPDDAVNGSAVLVRGRDQYVLPFDLSVLPRLHTRRDRSLADALPRSGRPGAASPVGAGLELRAVRWPNETRVGAFNDALIAADAQLLAADEPGEEQVNTWIGLPTARLDRFEAIMAELPGVRISPVFPTSYSQPSIANPSPDWPWGWLDTAQVMRGRRRKDPYEGPSAKPPATYVPPTWFLEYTRAPALWNLKAKAKNSLEVLVVDCSQDSTHPDLAISGTFPVPIVPPPPPGMAAKRNDHGLEVAGVIGARHDAPGAQVDNEGINPLVGISRTGVPATTLRATGVAQCTAEKTVPDSLADWNNVARAITADTRIINCSFSLDPTTVANAYIGYINVPYLIRAGDPMLFADIGKVLSFRANALVAVAQGKTLRDTAQYSLINKKLDGSSTSNFATNIAKALAALTKPITEMELYDLMGKAITDANYTPVGIPNPNYRNIFALMTGTIVLDPVGLAPALPEQTQWIPMIIEASLPDFLESDTAKKLLSGTILLVSGAGNYGTLAPPGPIGTPVTRWVGWPAGMRPGVHTFSYLGYIRHNRANPWKDILLLVGGLQATPAGVALWDQPTADGDDPGRGFGTVGGLPGELIYAGAARVGLLVHGGRGSGNGTSFAAPAVAGLASYLFALDPGSPSSDPDKKRQIQRFMSCLTDGARMEGTVPSVDSYATARLFLSGHGLTNPDLAYERGFDRMMCDCDDGTFHGNDKSAMGGPKNSGSSVEWLKGDGVVNMSDFRAFRDAWLQTHLFYPEPAEVKTVLEERPDYAFRFRDLPAAGLSPWDPTFNDVTLYRGKVDSMMNVTKGMRKSIRIWSRFDFDGSGLLEREQLCDAATLTLCRDITKGTQLPEVMDDKGYDLALLASLWPDAPSPWPAGGVKAPGQKDMVHPEDYEFITDPTQLLGLLPSCDLLVGFGCANSIFDEGMKAADGGTGIKSIQFKVERGAFNGAKFAPDGKLSYSRLVPEDRLGNFVTLLFDRTIFWLTVPLVEVKSSADLVGLDPKAKGFLGECLRVSAMVDVIGGKKPGMHELKAVVDPAIAAMANGMPQTDCVVAKLGGRYPILRFFSEEAANRAQPKVASGVKPVPGDKMQATIGSPVCVDCQASTLTVPTRPQRSASQPVRPGRPGPINPFGGGGGGGLQNGVGGFPGWNQAAGGAVASFTAMGPTLCYANILSALQYKDSDFEVTATVVPPAGTSIASASAGMSAGPGLTVQGAGPMSFAEGADDAVPGTAKPDPEGLKFTWTLRGDEGRRSYVIRVEGTLSSDSGTASFGPMELQGEIEIVQPFFLVALSFPAAAVENGKRFEMIATIVNSADVTGTAFDVVMSVSATNATPIDPRRELGDLAPGDAVTADFGFISALTGPIIGVSTSTMGRVSAEVSVGGADASPPSYPVEITAGLNALLSRYRALALAILAYAGSVYAEGLLRQSRPEVEAAAAIGYALHRAGFRLLDGEDDATVISALVLDAQGGATDNAAADELRRGTPVGRKVSAAAGPALEEAASLRGLLTPGALFDRFVTSQGGEPLFAALLGQAVPATLRDAAGRTVGDALRHSLPFSADYRLPGSGGRLIVQTRPGGSFELELDAGVGALELFAPSNIGGRRYSWQIPAGLRARVRVSGGEAELTLESGEALSPLNSQIVSDPPPRVVNVSLIPPTPYVSPYRNLEVRFSEAVDIPSAIDPTHYEVPGYGVERVSWYAPTRAAILFMDNPILDGATMTVRDVVDPIGQSVVVETIPVRGTAPAASVVGIARDPRGAPIPGARIAAFGDAGYRETFADPQGAFALEPLPLGGFTLEVYDPTTDRYGVSQQKLVEPGQRLGVDPQVEPDGTVSGRITGPDGRPIARAIVNILARWPYETGVFTDEDGLYRFTNVPLGSFSLGVLGGELSAGASGRLVEVDQVLVLDVQLRPRSFAMGTLRGVVLAPDGLPAEGTVVRLRGDAAAQASVGADGVFSFGPMPGGTLSIEARDRFERVVEQEIVLDGDKSLTLRLPALGGLRVDVFDAVGSPLIGATVYINSMEGPRAFTDATGAALFPTLPAGPCRVIAVLGERLGTEPVTIREGRVEELLVRLFPRAFILPATLTDANNVRWSVGAEGELRQVGNGFLYPGEGLALRVAGERFRGGGEATASIPGLELVLEQDFGAGLKVRRRVYCSPDDAFFLRVIDSFTNLRSEPQRVPVSWTAARFDGPPAELRPGVIAGGGSSWVRGPFGETSLIPATVEADSARAETEIVLNPGETRAVLHYLVTRPAADIAAASERLVQPPVQALVGFDAALAASLVNAALPEARGARSPDPVELSRGDVEVVVRTADGGLVGGARVLLNVHSAFYDRNGDGRAAPNGSALFRGLPAGQLSARASHPETGAADSAEGLVLGRQTVTLELPLRDTATVTGRVSRADGAPVGLCDVDLGGAVTRTAVDGSYLLRGVPLGQRSVVARERQFHIGRRASVSLTEPASVVNVDIRLPKLGIVSGRVLRGDGVAPVEAVNVSLQSLDPDNGFGVGALSGVDGRYDFAVVPEGPFRLYAQQGNAVCVATGTVREDGERVSVDLVLSAVGVVKGRTLSWDGGVLPGARVEIQDSRRAFVERSDTLGQYVCVGVSAGPVRVRVVPADGVGEGLAELSLGGEGERLIADVRVDREPPTLRILEPMGLLEGPMVAVAVEASDAERGLDAAGVRVQLNGREITGALTMVDGVRRGQVSLGQALALGDNILTASVSDKADNRAAAEQRFRVAAGSLRLGLRDPAGAPLSGVSVRLQDRLGERFLFVNDGAVVELPAGIISLELSYREQSPEYRYAEASGLIVDAQTLELPVVLIPVGGLSLRIFARDGQSAAAGARVELSRDGATKVYSADMFGSFTLLRQPVGTVSVRVSYQGDSTTTTLEIRGGQNAFAELFPSGLSVIEGIVRDPTGPVNGATVDLLVPGAEARRLVAANGVFRFDALRPGVLATLIGAAPGRSGSRQVYALPPPTVANVDLALAYTARAFLSGTVLGFDGQPAVNATVRLGNEVEGRTDEQGRYRLGPVRVGSFGLVARSTGGDQLNSSVDILPETEELTLNLQLPGRGALRLRVLRGPDPLPNIEVNLRAFYGQTPVTVRADSEGYAEFFGLVAGAADLFVRDPDSLSPQFLYAPISPGQTTQQEYRFPAFAEVTGVVYASDGVSPVPNFDVRGSGSVSFSARTDASGRYRAMEVYANPGDMTIEAFTNRNGFFDVRARVTRPSPSRHREVVEQDLVLSARGTVQGVLRGPEGPLPGLQVQLYGRGDVYFAQSRVSGPDGAYRFEDVPLYAFLIQASSEPLMLLGQVEGALSEALVDTQVDLLLERALRIPRSVQLGNDRSAFLRKTADIYSLCELRLNPEAEGFYPQSQDDFARVTAAGLELSMRGPNEEPLRRVVLANESVYFYRWLDILEVGEPIELARRFYPLGAENARPVESGPGWSIFKPLYPDYPDDHTALVWGDDSATSVLELESDGTPALREQLPGGQVASRLCFVVTVTGLAAARQAVQRMRGGAPEALQGLEGLVNLRDWSLPAAPLLDPLPAIEPRTVRVRGVAADGQTPVQLGQVEIRSLSPFFGYSQYRYSNSDASTFNDVPLSADPVLIRAELYLDNGQLESVATLDTPSEDEVLLRFEGAVLLRGRVLDANGAPQAGATARIGFNGVQSDAEGRFVLGPVRAGVKLVETDGASTFIEALPGLGAELELRRPRREAATATVVDAEGAPVVAVAVYALNGNRVMASRFTDTQGQVRIEDQLSEGLRVFVRHPVTQQAVLGPNGATLSLPGSGRLSGVVREADGTPLPFRSVQLRSPGGAAPLGLAADGLAPFDQIQYAYTDSVGGFVLPQTPVGDLELRVDEYDGRVLLQPIRITGDQQVELVFPARQMAARELRISVGNREGEDFQLRLPDGNTVALDGDGVAVVTLSDSPARILVQSVSRPTLATAVWAREQAELSVELPARASLSGTVLDASGEPVAYTSLHLYTSAGCFSYTGNTDEAGQFRFEALFVGEARVEVQARSGACSGPVVPLVEGENSAELRLPQRGSVVVKGEEYSRVELHTSLGSAYPDSGSIYGGEARFVNVLPGPLGVRAQTRPAVVVAELQPGGEVELTLPDQRPCTVYGRVVRQGQSWGAARVRADGQNSQEVRASDNGDFLFTQLSPGPLVLRVLSYEGATLALRLLELSPGSTLRVDPEVGVFDAEDILEINSNANFS